MQITQHFHSDEFACHDGSPYPSIWFATRLVPLCESLEILRRHINEPIYIASGYRTPTHNAKIGGARFSQHCEGRAADIYAFDRPPGLIHLRILYLIRAKAISNIRGLGLYPKFVHIDIRPGPRLVRWTGSRTTS